MTLPTFKYEEELWSKGFKAVCGVDEVGRGSFAGPVVSAAVIFKPNQKLPDGINDSKLLSPEKRLELAAQIKEVALAWVINKIDVSVINEIGIGKATQQSFLRSVENIKVKPDFILVDAFAIVGVDPKIQKAIVHGDQLSLTIAAASIIAKVYRDQLMEALSQRYQKYGFNQHKGYGTKAHQEAIKEFGLCELHRKSFDLTKFS